MKKYGFCGIAQFLFYNRMNVFRLSWSVIISIIPEKVGIINVKVTVVCIINAIKIKGEILFMKNRSVFLFLVILCLILAGCSGGSGSDSNSNSGTYDVSGTVYNSTNDKGLVGVTVAFSNRAVSDITDTMGNDLKWV
jgi:hypothetical protein